jgi:hypothetical protein
MVPRHLGHGEQVLPGPANQVIQLAHNFPGFLVVILVTLGPAYLMDNRGSPQNVTSVFGVVVKNAYA